MLIHITYSSGIPDETIECLDGSDVNAIMTARFGHPNVLAQLGGRCKQWEEHFTAELRDAEARTRDLFSSRILKPTPAPFPVPAEVNPVTGEPSA